MAVSADIFDEQDEWRGPLAVSVALHGILIISMFAYAYVFGRGTGENWGGTTSGGEAMGATLVSSIPLPAKPDATNVLANDSKGLTESKPKPKVEEPDAIPIPDKTTKIKPPKKPVTPTQTKPAPAPEVADNKIPFGEGGPVSGPYGNFNSGATKGGFGFTGGGGDFGSRYAWYVDTVRRKVSDNWLKYEVDPTITTARRVYITFDINRSGSPTNIAVEQSSGVPSLDQSAVRALKRIDTFGPLPNDYAGNRVSVEFWFDYKR